MRRKTAKEILAESFREIAGTKNINKITIRDIVDNCGYSPATFYRNFKDKYDLIAWEHTRGVAEIMSRIDADSYTWKQSLCDGARWFDQEREYLTNLLQYTTGHDSFVRYMVEINYNALIKHILSVKGNQKPDQMEEMLARTYCLGTVGLTCEWILGLYDITPEEIADVYEYSLPVPLKKYLAAEPIENDRNLSL
ncbi:MAG: TetR/AcrR family transcriptional regulator C-terminal domain-containing protein [Lachnospiraceae bacterium]|nr:TetR/AcrR family transcriptional regulator C-terminal domain-containing protein [Lachnospiraceae bacterium]